MEPINFRSALRRWPVVVGVAVVVAVGAVFFPVKVHKVGKAMYAASATIGVPPSSGKKGTSSSSSGDAIKEISFDTDIQTVMGNAAKAAGVKQSAVRLEKDLSISGKKGKKGKKNAGPSNTLTFSISQPTAKGSATLTNDYAKALGEYLDTSAASHQKAALKAAQEQVANIESELNTVNEQIAQLVQSGGAGASTPSNGSNKGKGGGGTRTNPTLADLETQSQSLTAAYGQAIGKEQQIQNSPTAAVSFLIIRPATPGGAKKIVGKVSAIDHHSVRGALGLGAGLVLGVGVVLLLEALDRRIKTAKRAADVFDLPVVAEIPLMRARPASKAKGTPPPTPGVVVVNDPTSPAAEAYRRLHMAVLLDAPVPVAEPEHVYPNGASSVPGLSPGTSANGSPARPASGLWVAEPVLAPPVRMAVRPTTRPPSKRQVIMVVSPGFEPTRSSVVANLAATYAEAGERALVIATQDLRQGNGFNGGYGPVPPAPDRPIGPADIEAHMVPSPIEGVCSLALGALLHGPGQLATHAEALIAATRQVADVVLVEAAPLLVTHDAEALLPAVDLVVVVGECEMTKVDQARQAGDLLLRAGAPVLGLVVTRVRLAKKDLRTTTPWEVRAPAPAPQRRSPRKERALKKQQAAAAEQPSSTAFVGQAEEGDPVNGVGQPHAVGVFPPR